jgi:hypothetical protein
MGEASSSELVLALAPTPLVIDGVVFPAFASAPAPACDSSKPPLFLAGAGLFQLINILVLLIICTNE